MAHFILLFITFYYPESVKVKIKKICLSFKKLETKYRYVYSAVYTGTQKYGIPAG